MKHHLSTSQIEFLYSLLVAGCDAPDDPVMRQQFKHHILNDKYIEFRFQGCFGLGGKIYIQGTEIYVAGYPEDMTPELEKRCGIINGFLKVVSRKWFADS